MALLAFTFCFMRQAKNQQLLKHCQDPVKVLICFDWSEIELHRICDVGGVEEVLSLVLNISTNLNFAHFASPAVTFASWANCGHFPSVQEVELEVAAKLAGLDQLRKFNFHEALMKRVLGAASLDVCDKERSLKERLEESLKRLEATCFETLAKSNQIDFSCPQTITFHAKQVASVEMYKSVQAHFRIYCDYLSQKFLTEGIDSKELQSKIVLPLIQVAFQKKNDGALNLKLLNDVYEICSVHKLEGFPFSIHKLYSSSAA